MGSATGAGEAAYICAKCNRPMTPDKVVASYLGSEFRIELWKCPDCGKVLVPKDLAMGKILQVEQALEDK